ncbi:aminotransferase class I/II-fold pyridoxal phosphate-dependent enzyme [Streptomyces sp. ME03-5684b]|uniref:aminotransferase class I/II-fold pyridoxal phosphate-dependent enzyme n=1 Tax=Streptomyces sp. ME03-5684b TaxID=3028681 RepID=UPI0029B843CD|nr:aminotransferase class I/II-fold pyridoxal phosphate-dependent enzyme [Streptomyces sp. ME03-5684b]MDX3319081.1 aminotransferase class I/II-fold pyridoxal phosphate-dependent enzyme [Streptomyces sp. ME03-5684b]
MTDSVDALPDTARIRERVVHVIAARTLYDESHLRPESHFEADLGIDSVIMESVLVSVREHFGLSAALPAGPTTIGELVDAVGAALAGTGDDRPAPAAGPLPAVPAEGTGDLVTEAVVAAAMRQTQYQRHQLGLDADLEGELGVDSVVLTSVVAEATERLGLTGAAPDAAGATTLRALADALRGLVAAAPGTAVPEAAPATGAAAPAPGRSGNAPAPGADGWDHRSMKDFTEQRDPDLFAKTRSFAGYLRSREKDRLYWYGMPLHSRCGSRAVIFDELEGRKREFLMFASNNYLGLANHPSVIEAVVDATRTYGATHTGSRFIGGTNMLHKELERRLAAFKQRPACIVYPGGYSANLGAISALVKSYDTLVVDRLNHMSIVDGARLSGAVRKIYRHNDMADLERILSRSAAEGTGGRLIVADGVFSMHGDVCDLPEIVRLAKEYDARVMIDDAHATGVLGVRGSGTAEHFGLKGEVDLELGTMSKTLAGMGGFVVGEEEVVEYLRYYSNSYVFAANIPAGVAAGLIASIDVIESEPERLKRLWTNIGTLRDRLLDAGFDLEHSESAILPIVIGDERRAMELGRAVRARGLFCQTVVYPGVPLGDARLRVSVTCEHTPQDLELAAEIFVDAARETGVLPGTP